MEIHLLAGAPERTGTRPCDGGTSSRESSSPGSTPRTTCPATRRPGTTPSLSGTGPGSNGVSYLNAGHLARETGSDSPQFLRRLVRQGSCFAGQ